MGVIRGLRESQRAMARYDVTIIGNNRFAAGLVMALIEEDLKPDLVVTLGAAGRRDARIAGVDSTLADWARSEGIEVHECDGFRMTSARDRSFFSDNEFGIGVCTDWQHLIAPSVLDAFAAGIFGFHGSLMEFPNGRGRSPFNWSIRLGGTSIHHNCFRYSERADEGGVFRTTEIPIGPEDDIRLLQFKALVDYRMTIANLIRSHRAGELSLVPQPEAASVWLPKLTPEDSRLQFSAMSITQILNVIRASSHPFVGAYGETAAGERLVFWRSTRYDGPVDPRWADAVPGTILLAALDSVLVKCRDGLLVGTELTTAGNIEAFQRQVLR